MAGSLPAWQALPPHTHTTGSNCPNSLARDGLAKRRQGPGLPGACRAWVSEAGLRGPLWLPPSLPPSVAEGWEGDHKEQNLAKIGQGRQMESEGGREGGREEGAHLSSGESKGTRRLIIHPPHKRRPPATSGHAWLRLGRVCVFVCSVHRRTKGPEPNLLGGCERKAYPSPTGCPPATPDSESHHPSRSGKDPDGGAETASCPQAIILGLRRQLFFREKTKYIYIHNAALKKRADGVHLTSPISGNRHSGVCVCV